MTLRDRFPCVIPIDVRFRDVDSLGHVNNAVYLTYFEEGRVAYGMQLAGVSSLSDLRFIVAEATVSYKRPAFFRERLLLGVRVGEIGNKSFVMEYELCRESGEVVATGRTVQVWYDYTAQRSAPVPDSFRQAVAQIQGQAA